MSSHLEDFAATLPFALDGFQLEGCRALDEGHGVLVAAPTGAGKTLVGEFAVHLALAEGRKAFYTTPIKALSNQKYHDLVARHGADKVGLLTGDTSINGEAPVVVMTTEVLRNMMYAASPTLKGLGYVVMDEVHYLADRFRGAVWEEVIIHLAQDVALVALSATVSNAEEFGGWLDQVRGGPDQSGLGVEVVVSEHRPVPLWQHMMVGRTIHDLFVDEQTIGRSGRPDSRPRLNPDLVQSIRAARGARAAERGRGANHPGRGTGRGPRGRGGDPEFGRRGRGRGRQGRQGRDGAQDWAAEQRGGRAEAPAPGAGQAARPPSRAEVIERLERDGLLPAITFIFSRAGCTAAVEQLIQRGVRLIDPEEGERNRIIVEERISGLPESDLSVLGYWDFVDGITRGYAAHHAGMLPTFRGIVEELFTQGRIRAVFATETLALGINMPARTVVIEKLVKFNGEQHVDLSPAEFTQLTGRAGRRGIDVEGHAVVLWTPRVDPEALAGLASTRTYPLRSSFRPTYNMAVNLVRRVGRETATEILETSFAQFQADRSVVGQSRTIRRNEEALAGYAESMHCDRGDFTEYAALRDRIRAVEKSGAKARAAAARAAISESFAALRAGDVIHIDHGRHAGYAVVIAPSRGGGGHDPAPGVITEDKRSLRLAVGDVAGPVQPVTTIRIGKQVNPKSPKARSDLAASVRAAVPFDPPPRDDEGTSVGVSDEVLELRERMRTHPCHDCPDREHHARWAERWFRLRRETDALQARINSRTHTVARTFDRICDLLVETGYLTAGGTALTEAGERLTGLYTEKDLLLAECLARGVFKKLDAPSLASVVSMLIHEARREESGREPRLPTADLAETYEQMQRVWGEIVDMEQQHDLPQTGEIDAGIAWAVHRWAAGRGLDECLRGTDLAAGDFVRRCKQVVDVLGQLTSVDDKHLSAVARQAIDGVMRGVVAADRLD